MDPSATLTMLRDALADAASPTPTVDREVAIEQAAQALDDLDTWLMRGGALPLVWQANR